MKTFSQYINEEFRFSIPHNKVKSQYKYFPKLKKELAKAIEAEIELQGPEADLNCIDTSKITDMSYLFDVNTHGYAKNFDGDISKWDVSNVENMKCMFVSAKNFDGDISKWDVSKVKYTNSMFYNAISFNQDISSWDVSNVENMYCMFYYAKSFNQDISKWDVRNVETIEGIFDHCPIKYEYKPEFN